MSFAHAKARLHDLGYVLRKEGKAYRTYPIGSGSRGNMPDLGAVERYIWQIEEVRSFQSGIKKGATL